MPNTIALAQAYLKDAVKLNQVAKEALLTGDLEANRVQFVGANTVKLPSITFGAGLGTYSRATGFVENDITLSWDTFTLSQDKGNSLKLDAMDDEEGLGQELVPYVNEYIRTVEVPEVDKYRLGVLATAAGTTEVETIALATAITQLMAGFETLKENEFPEEGLILYCTPAIDTLFQLSPELQRYIRVDEVRNGEVSTKVRYFNGAKIVVVPSNRMPAKANFILVHPSAQMSVVKHNPAHYYGVGTVPGFDGGQVDIRLYHDCFVIDNRKMGIYVSETA